MKKEEEERERERKRLEKERIRLERRKEREAKRRAIQLEKRRKQEEKEMQHKIALEERKILIAQRKLETIRLLSELFKRVKVRQQLSRHFIQGSISLSPVRRRFLICPLHHGSRSKTQSWRATAVV